MTIKNGQLVPKGAGVAPLVGPGDVPARVEHLRRVMFAAITDEAVQGIIGVMIEKALGGDAKAQRDVLDFIRPEEALNVNVDNRSVNITATGGAIPPGVILRKLCARFLLSNKSANVAVLAREMETTTTAAEEILSHPWFAFTAGEYVLTPAGRSAVG